MSDTYRVGKTLGPTIYRNDEEQPVMFGVSHALAARIVAFLNAESYPLAVEGEKEWRLSYTDVRAGKVSTKPMSESNARLSAGFVSSTTPPVVEFSTDGGKTWVDADVQEGTKGN